jgi:hypothetical protein
MQALIPLNTLYTHSQEQGGNNLLKRNNQIHVYLDDKELKDFKARVRKSGISQSAYIRHLFAGQIPKDKPPPEYFEMLKQMQAIGRNINQIALVANATGIIGATRYEEQYSDLLGCILKIIDETQMPQKEK